MAKKKKKSKSNVKKEKCECEFIHLRCHKQKGGGYSNVYQCVNCGRIIST